MGESIKQKYCTCINIYWENLFNRISVHISISMVESIKQKWVNCCLDIIISITVNSFFPVSQTGWFEYSDKNVFKTCFLVT